MKIRIEVDLASPRWVMRAVQRAAQLPSNGRFVGAALALLVGTVTSAHAAWTDPDATTAGMTSGQQVHASPIKALFDETDVRLTRLEEEGLGSAEQLSMTGFAGFGTTDSAIVHFATVASSAPDALFVDNGTPNGTVVTVLKSGVYAISAFVRDDQSAQQFGILRNGTGAQLNMSVGVLVKDSGYVAICGSSGGGAMIGCATTIILRVNDKIRVGTDVGFMASGASQWGLTMTRVRGCGVNDEWCP